ncbi:Transcription factor bHLH125 [Carex littledalei]|uniref:Transcription factor bHLH125 n=1 Tax=Carex littledalei TaxID=544730 RepID=A0A833VMV9_9POAL|nr:Transcription factor bHLH125 [Carex littledalei]
MKSSGSNSSSNGGGERCCSKMERKTIEKQRRMQMKSLCLKLSSLIPKQQPQHISHSSKDALTQLDNLDEAASYIINLRNKIEKLKERREHERRMQGRTDDITSTGTGHSSNKNNSKLLILPIIEVRYQNGNLEVLLILNNSSSEKLTFHKVIRIIEEEGVDIVNASHSTMLIKLSTPFTLRSVILEVDWKLQEYRVDLKTGYRWKFNSNKLVLFWS